MKEMVYLDSERKYNKRKKKNKIIVYSSVTIYNVKVI